LTLCLRSDADGPVDLRRQARVRAILEGESLSRVVAEQTGAWLSGKVELKPERRDQQGGQRRTERATQVVRAQS
jgi:hypothetical protein